MPPFAFKTVFNTKTTTSLYIPFVFVLYFIFECRNLFHLTLMDERAYVFVPYIPSSCKKYDEEV